VDAFNFPEMFFNVPYMWSELIMGNKAQSAYADFDPEFQPQAHVRFTPITEKGNILLV